ncbi:DNA-methyltransferase [Pontibacillus halophilus JSM 076056 = DSM 19796]|uniref:DNA-methyltransferase n=1 Tax=Pontibacillus halophilus JSM 076056 = DSM 19796 TaxID=1385510 RepID=A0A0A5GJB8_9BACI|nr:class I SAM-dependent methyltransferase [Pontibacillus halophilus]KGX93351.1 DNA-methyltransferase [Pontibacillus halophilus JSM 076056 = DSM 19796]
MEQDKIEQLYQLIDELAGKIEAATEVPYLDAITLVCDSILEDEPKEALPSELQEEVKQKISEISNIDDWTKEERRKGMQLAILKGMKGSTQQQHYITPDAVAMFMGYLIQKLLPIDGTPRLFDPVIGTANLMTAVLNQLKRDVDAYGSDVDPSLVQLGVANANLQQQDIEFFHQDSLRPFLLEPVDFVMADLPVGYYPDDVNASNYELQAQEGHSYSHHLLMEQGLNYLKDGGFGLFLIPNFLFEGDQSDQLHEFLQKHTHVFGVLQLPETMFKNEKFGKSIFIIQKKGSETTPPNQALIAQLPSFKNAKAMNDMLTQINEWFKEYLSKK